MEGFEQTAEAHIHSSLYHYGCDEKAAAHIYRYNPLKRIKYESRTIAKMIRWHILRAVLSPIGQGG